MWLEIVHKYLGESQWTMCGRYVKEIKGMMYVKASDKDHEVTCKACRRYIDESGTEEEE